MRIPQRILISRTDAIGDVVLTLPLAGILRQHFPAAKIGFLGKTYTQPVIACYSSVDEFIDVEAFLKTDNKKIRKDWDAIVHVFPRRDVAKKALLARIPLRVGTGSRPYHWLTCNRLVTLNRRNSDLHEAQLNAVLLKPLGIQTRYSTTELPGFYNFRPLQPLPVNVAALLTPGKRHIILHPKSQGSAREWGLDNFEKLIRLLAINNNYQLFISGTATDAIHLKPLLQRVKDRVTDLTGLMDLEAFITFINECDALVAASTGPLHIAAACGKFALGIYPSIRPMHVGRWGPIGVEAKAFALPEPCTDCRDRPESCHCIQNIPAVEIADWLEHHLVHGQFNYPD